MKKILLSLVAILVLAPAANAAIIYSSNFNTLHKNETNREALERAAADVALLPGDREAFLNWTPDHEECTDRTGPTWVEYEDGFRFLFNTDIWECTCPTCYPERAK